MKCNLIIFFVLLISYFPFIVLFWFGFTIEGIHILLFSKLSKLIYSRFLTFQVGFPKVVKEVRECSSMLPSVVSVL